jgi:hypothetical protein
MAVNFSEIFVSPAFKIHAFENKLNPMTVGLRINLLVPEFYI